MTLTNSSKNNCGNIQGCCITTTGNPAGNTVSGLGISSGSINTPSWSIQAPERDIKIEINQKEEDKTVKFEKLLDLWIRRTREVTQT